MKVPRNNRIYIENILNKFDKIYTTEILLTDNN